MNDKNPILKNIRENPIQLAIQVIGVVIVLANLWLATKLAPMAQNIDKVTTRVEAIENRNIKIDPLVNDYITTKQEVKDIENILTEMKQDIRDIKIRVYNISNDR